MRLFRRLMGRGITENHPKPQDTLDLSETPEPLQIQRPPGTWRVLCKYDTRFPPPDPEFIQMMSEHRVMVPLSQVNGKHHKGRCRQSVEAKTMEVAKREGWAENPEELVFVPIHRPGKSFDTIHGRSAHTSTPLDMVGKIPEYTFKGLGYRISGGNIFDYAAYEDIYERRWCGFALFPTIKQAVNVTLEIHGEFEKAKAEGDPVVLEAVEKGFTKAPTLKYGCVVRPLQTIGMIDFPEAVDYNRELLLPEEIKEIKSRGVGIHAIHRGIEFDMKFKERADLNQFWIKILEKYSKEEDMNINVMGSLTLRDVFAIPDNLGTMWFMRNHRIKASVENGKLKLMDLTKNAKDEKEMEITPQQAIELIEKRNARMLQEKDRIRDNMVLFGYSVPLQIRVAELPSRAEPIGPEKEETLKWEKTLRWYGVKHDVRRFSTLKGETLTPEQVYDRIMDGFTTGCALAYHLVVNRRKGLFTTDVGSAVLPINFLTCGYFVDNDTVTLDREDFQPVLAEMEKRNVSALIYEMHKRTSWMIELMMTTHELSDKEHFKRWVEKKLGGGWLEPKSNVYIARFDESVNRGREYLKTRH